MQKNDYSRYKSQIGLIGSIGQDLLSKSKILCVGSGGLGTLVATYLVAAGVNKITLVDGDKVELTNLTRQITYTEDDCGKYKVVALKKHLNLLNSSCNVIAHNIFLDNTNAEEFITKYDLIIDCSDNFATRYLVNDTCKLVEKSLISGSIDGFMGQVMVFLADVCYRCIFPSANNSSSCNNSNVIGSNVGIIASMMANEALKFLTKFNQQSKLIQINSLDNTIKQFKIKADSKCRNNHFYDFLDNESFIKPTTFDELIQLSATNSELISTNDTAKKAKLILIDLRNAADKTVIKLPVNLPTPINLDDLLTNKIPVALEQNIIVICNHGYQSKLTALQLASLGYKHVCYVVDYI